MNRVCLIGRITAKPELRQTPNGIALTRFTLAVNRAYTDANGQKQADFIPVQAWRKQAENICRYLDKGGQVSVEGRVQVDSYTDKDGNKRNLTYVVADNVQFLESKKKEKAEEQVDIYAEFGEQIDEDEFLD